MNSLETWDRWYAAAIAAGVPEPLATLGREVMRDVLQHGLDESITLGESDDGPLLIDMMLLAPLSTERRLASDQLSRLGYGDEALNVVDQIIAKRLSVDEDDVSDLIAAEKDGLDQAYRADAQRRPENYGPQYRN